MTTVFKIHRRDDPFARIDNRVINDTRLSYKALGLLTYLLSKPADWQIRAGDLTKDMREGRDAVRAAFKELALHGYARLTYTRIGKQWSIYEAPRAKDGFSGDGPCPEKAKLAKPVYIQTKEKSTNERPADAGAGFFAERVMRIMHRRESTGFSEKEAKAYKKIAQKITDDDLLMVERYYIKNWPPHRDRNILRHDLYTFLNNYFGEVDRALQWCEKHPLPSSRVLKTVLGFPVEGATIAADPESEEKFVASFEAHFHRMPHGYQRVDGKLVYNGKNGE